MTTLAALLPGLKAIRVFTSSGTWVKPNDIRFALVEVIGGGGGGGNAAGTGGTSSFATVSATGGGGGGITGTALTFIAGGAGGLGAGGDINYHGGRGGYGMYNDIVTGQFGWPAASRYMPYGQGGIGQTVTTASGRGGGGGGGYARKIFDVSALADSVPVTIGAGGSGPNGGGANSGLVVVYEYA